MSDSPTAVHAVGDVHDTLLRKVSLYITPPGLGVRWIVHVKPFQLSASGSVTPERRKFPTAVHASGEVQDTL